jgi:hypothetical protein
MSSPKSSAEIKEIRERLADRRLEDADLPFLLGIVDYALELRQAVEASSEQAGGKTILAKLPFGVDIVK